MQAYCFYLRVCCAVLLSYGQCYTCLYQGVLQMKIYILLFDSDCTKNREVDEVNTGAVKLYENAGFVKDEKRRSKKIGRFFMTKSIQS